MKKLIFVSLICHVLISEIAGDGSEFRQPTKLEEESKWAIDYNDDEDTAKKKHTHVKEDWEIKNDEIKKTIEECQPYQPPVPDYTKKGRRVSEVKCLEFQWQSEVRGINAKRSIKCNELLNEKHGQKAGSVVEPDAKGEYPHMAAVGWRGENNTWIFKCGATLISEKFVLTAAHCTRAPNYDTSVVEPDPKIVRIDFKDIDEHELRLASQRQDRLIKRIIKHPDYKPPKKYDDIALIELRSAVKFSEFIHPACLWGDDTKSLTQASVTGWGFFFKKGGDNTSNLETTEVKILDEEQCNSTLTKIACGRGWCGLKRQLCATIVKGGVDACQGDSGGPLQVNIDLAGNTTESMHYVIGVTSFGVQCSIANTPGVYTKVSSYIDWIENIVWGNIQK